MQHNRAIIGIGSFGTVYYFHPNLCVKATNFSWLDRDIDAVRDNFFFTLYGGLVIEQSLQQWQKAVAPSIYSSHPNVLPCYGAFFRKAMGYLVSPFMNNGNLLNYALRLSQKSRMPLVSSCQTLLPRDVLIFL
jgi:hypothetical protein